MKRYDPIFAPCLHVLRAFVGESFALGDGHSGTVAYPIARIKVPGQSGERILARRTWLKADKLATNGTNPTNWGDFRGSARVSRKIRCFVRDVCEVRG
ncbi:MAG: hypothetical protein M3T55_08410 [Pseudomonadota bacterium]|nr:hypothetical protein [Pseudomonadota bacterium]